RNLYNRANALIANIQVSFEETLKFHNDLIAEKIKYVTNELPELEQKLKSLNAELLSFRKQENDLTTKLQKTGVAEDLEIIVGELNKQYERKGNLEEQKRLWEVSDQNIRRIEGDLQLINEEITSNDDL